jgi:ABC-2 type transport system ATP-binding protein
VIETDGLSKTYNDIEALKSLNLKVPKNSIFGFLGPNGAGKSTTMKLLRGLTRPSSGTGSIFGQDIVNSNIEIRLRTGYLPQDFNIGSLGHLTARELLRFTAKFYFKGPDDEIENRVQEMLELVNLEEKADRPIEGFSGGEKQRLGIAQAQINHPDLLILDEPAAALDPIGRRDVLEVMERLRKHTTIFYSTHILDDVQRVSDTVAILNRGELVAQGPIEKILNGNEGTFYIIELKGDTSKVYEYLLNEPWVSDIDETDINGIKRWQVRVTDKNEAEAKMLGVLHLNKGDARVISFKQKSYELEDIFLDLVEA